MLKSELTRRRLAWVAFLSAVALLFSFGCGRSSIDIEPLEGGTDAGFDAHPDARTEAGTACGPQNCGGCCDAKGACKTGNAIGACGSLGSTCADCVSAGFDFCDATTRACGRAVSHCDATTCADGCCQGNLCLSGADPNACGSGGEFCQACASMGLACDTIARQCTSTGCGPATCPGCCLGDQCIDGTQATACGAKGQQCDNCLGFGEVCSPIGGIGGFCIPNAPTCGPGNCSGCCIGNTCLPGNSATACGSGGSACVPCSNFGSICAISGPAGGFCVSPPVCGPGNCNGCCMGNTCLPGVDNFQCGMKGQQCQTCPVPQVCGGVPGGGGSCQIIPPPLCGPTNCNGCCQGGTCVPGGAAFACGTSGSLCTNCALFGETCVGGACKPITPPTCTAANCPGCCDPVFGCQAGFLNTSCGSGGGSCTNCSAKGATCDVAVTPRVCSSQTSTCPAPYAGCPGGVATPPRPVQHVCSANELQNARAACGGGAQSAACVQYFAFEATTNPTCAKCLTPFDVDFQNALGLYACVAPYVSPACDHATGCVVDCVVSSCAQCPAGTASSCRSSATSGACSSYVQQTQCIAGALFGSGAFCNPANYQGNFGAWLQGVGGHYCQ